MFRFILRPLMPMKLFPVDPWCRAPAWAIALRDEVRDLERKVNRMARTLDDVLADVTAERSQIDSLAQLTTGLKEQLDAVLAGALTPEQQAKVDAIFEGVESNKAAIVLAINANTPASPTPPTPPAEPTG